MLNSYVCRYNWYKMLTCGDEKWAKKLRCQSHGSLISYYRHELIFSAYLLQSCSSNVKYIYVYAHGMEYIKYSMAKPSRLNLSPSPSSQCDIKIYINLIYIYIYK